MALTFPTGLFGFLDQEVDIERQTLKGGTAISGEQDIISSDGGGRVFAEFASGALVDRDKVLAWRALLGELEEGVTRIVVPFCDRRHSPSGRRTRVPHSDGTPFSDDSLYVGGGVLAQTTDALATRATSLRYTMTGGQPIIGGEWFSITHPNKGDRAYKVRSVQDDGSIRFSPPLREAVEAGTPIDFENPRCLMTQDPASRPSARVSNQRYTDAGIRFIEAP